jgi:hypothetical protein
MYKVIFNFQISNLNLRIFQRWNEHKYKCLEKARPNAIRIMHGTKNKSKASGTRKMQDVQPGAEPHQTNPAKRYNKTKYGALRKKFP